MDLLEENVRLVNAQAQENGWTVQAFAQDVASDWPIAPDSLEVAIDVFCYKHIASKREAGKVPP